MTSRTPAKSSLLFALLACASAPPPATKVEATSAVTLTDVDGSSIRVTVEIADDPAERQHGLMQRMQMDEMAGMLFVFPQESHQSFWMKDTFIPLDMIFIRADMTVAGIVANAEPLTTNGRSVEGSSQFVLEVNGGFCERHRIVTGSRVRFEAVNVKAAK